MKILVTGGSGDIGKYVVKELVSHDITATILDICQPDKRYDGVELVQCDLMDLNMTIETIRGYDVVIHLAAIPNPFNDPPDRVMKINIITCFNVLEAIRQNGIPRIVYGCSESASGFGIRNRELKPAYLPIDEKHPCWPHESYSLSKYFGEEMVKNYAHAYGIAGISLRYCWVWLERDIKDIQNFLKARLHGECNPKPWFGCYIAPHDVAQATRLASLYQFPAEQPIPFEAFYLTADTTFLSEPTLKALKHHFDPLPEVLDPEYFQLNPYAAVFDSRKAKHLLGFKPAKSWETFEQWEKPT